MERSLERLFLMQQEADEILRTLGELEAENSSASLPA